MSVTHDMVIFFSPEVAFSIIDTPNYFGNYLLNYARFQYYNIK
jgi:hypothetical protein